MFLISRFVSGCIPVSGHVAEAPPHIRPYPAQVGKKVISQALRPSSQQPADGDGVLFCLLISDQKSVTSLFPAAGEFFYLFCHNTRISFPPPVQLCHSPPPTTDTEPLVRWLAPRLGTAPPECRKIAQPCAPPPPRAPLPGELAGSAPRDGLPRPSWATKPNSTSPRRAPALG